jgi:hypothetical protein
MGQIIQHSRAYRKGGLRDARKPQKQTHLRDIAKRRAKGLGR